MIRSNSNNSKKKNLKADCLNPPLLLSLYWSLRRKSIYSAYLPLRHVLGNSSLTPVLRQVVSWSLYRQKTHRDYKLPKVIFLERCRSRPESQICLSPKSVGNSLVSPQKVKHRVIRWPGNSKNWNRNSNKFLGRHVHSSMIQNNQRV